MSDADRGQPEIHQQTIRPARIDLSRRGAANGITQVPSTRYLRFVSVTLLFGILVAAAIGVIVVLPDLQPAIAPTDIPAGNTATDNTHSTPIMGPVGGNPPKGESPWEKAIRSGLRKDSQRILESLLEARKSLEEHGVMQWAAADFEQAMETAAAGDGFYNRQDFENAHNRYQEALDKLTRLVDRTESMFEETMKRGLQALNEGDSATAREAFQLALAIDPMDRDADTGRQRAEVLDEVIALLAEGDDLLDAARLDETRERYSKARELDPAYPATAEKLRMADARIQERAFGKYMSAGFAALEANRLDEAHKSFSEALRTAPGSVEARNALEQTTQKLTGNRIKSLLEQAAGAEAAEDWQAARKAYQDALAIDAHLAAAQAGVENSGLRVEIHGQVAAIIDHPERLYDPEIYAETRVFLNRIAALSQKGPVLSRQLVELERLLAKAAVPVRVHLQSDNQTEVTVYKVGKFGYFADLELELRPGPYVAVGIRPGYQDARTEFLVEPDKAELVVQIRADKPILLSR